MLFLKVFIFIIGLVSFYYFTNIILSKLKRKFFQYKRNREYGLILYASEELSKFDVATAITTLDTRYIDDDSTKSLKLSSKEKLAIYNLQEKIVELGFSYIFIADKNGEKLLVHATNPTIKQAEIALEKYR